MFIDLIVGQFYFRALGDDQWEPHPLGTWALALQQDASGTRQKQFTDRVPLRRRLFLQLPVEGRGNIHCGADAVVFHKSIISLVP